MNKEIIKKYKDVFDYWLDGGKVWVKFSTCDGWQEEHIDSQSTFDWVIPSSVIVIVQNDEYVEFRKALADGKRIQYKYKGTPDNYDWMGFSINDYTNYIFETKYIYRIKPDEPKTN